VTPELAARELYSMLRDADAGPATLLVVAMVDPTGLGRAVNDRIFRAAHGRVVLDASPSTVDRIAQLVG
jgi:L-threonylcarbamoyladenylate synthase